MRLQRRRDALVLRQRAASAAGTQSEAEGHCGRSDQRRARRRSSATGHQRPEHWRQDRVAEDHWPAGADGAVGRSGSGRSRRAADLRCRVRRHRRLPVDRAEPLDLLGARHQHRFHLAHATRDSLVLLDELGSATDPEEGAALAVAIADHFRARRCCVA